MTLDRHPRIRALAICVSLLLAGLATAAGSGAADAGSVPVEAFYYPSGNQFPG